MTSQGRKHTSTMEVACESHSGAARRGTRLAVVPRAMAPLANVTVTSAPTDDADAGPSVTAAAPAPHATDDAHSCCPPIARATTAEPASGSSSKVRSLAIKTAATGRSVPTAAATGACTAAATASSNAADTTGDVPTSVPRNVTPAESTGASSSDQTGVGLIPTATAATAAVVAGGRDAL